MTRPTLCLVPLVLVALAVGGCTKTQPGATAAPVGSSPVAGPSVPASAASSSPSPSAAAMVLAGDGLGGFRFGTAQATVAARLTERLGPPTDSGSARSCELDQASPWSQTLIYQDFWVEFEAKDSKKTSPRSLRGWGFQLNGTLPSALAMADGVPLDLSFTELKAAYPGTKTLDLGLQDGTVAVQLPNKLIFYGVGQPEVVRGGAIGVCE